MTKVLVVMDAYLFIKSPPFILNICWSFRVGGWIGRWIAPYSYPLYVKHFKIGSHHSFMIVLMIVHSERVLFGKTNSSGWL